MGEADDIRIAICDDDPNTSAGLKQLCEELARTAGLSLDIRCFDSAEDYLASGQAAATGVLLLDIYMGGLDGIGLARRLRAEGFESPIILVTSSREHGLEGFEVGAVHYLLKPVRREDFFEAMRRCHKRLDQAARSISVTSNRRQVSVPLSAILYAEVAGHKTSLVTGTGVLPLSISLAEVRDLLDDPRFIQCFRSYIVNMDQIQEMRQDYFLMGNGDRVPIAKRELASIKDLYMNHMFNENG